MDKAENDPGMMQVGIDYKHEPGFAINYSEGAGFYFFLYLISPVIIDTEAGREEVPGGRCIFYSDDFPAWYQGKGVGLHNDWFRVFGDLRVLLDQYGLPVNRTFEIHNADFIRPLLSQMEGELLGEHEHARRAATLYMEQVLILLSRNRHTGVRSKQTRRRAELENVFRKIRHEVLACYDAQWTVSDMAKKAHLSPNRFAVLYKSYFSVSPIEDLLNIRIEQAKWLLNSTNMSVAEVASSCGFQNIYYFSRAFKKRTGIPPVKYSTRGAKVKSN